ncbi:hypothetical protein PCE1_004954 [Barthelona sp. PCE]
MTASLADGERLFHQISRRIGLLEGSLQFPSDAENLIAMLRIDFSTFYSLEFSGANEDIDQTSFYNQLEVLKSRISELEQSFQELEEQLSMKTFHKEQKDRLLNGTGDPQLQQTFFQEKFKLNNISRMISHYKSSAMSSLERLFIQSDRFKSIDGGLDRTNRLAGQSDGVIGSVFKRARQDVLVAVIGAIVTFFVFLYLFVFS